MILGEDSALLHADGADGAGLGGIHGGGHFLAGDLAHQRHGQCALHREHGGADARALGAADAQVGVYECSRKTNPPLDGFIFPVLQGNMLGFLCAVWYNNFYGRQEDKP